MAFQRKYTDEQKDFFKNCKGISYKDIQKIFNDKYDMDITLSAVKRQIRDAGGNGIDSKFRKGNESFLLVKNPYRNTGMENGTETLRDRGRGSKEYFIKVNGKWIRKSKYVWQQNYGPVPAGYEVWFKNGDHMDCSIENLILLKKSESIEFVRKGFNTIETELRETAINVAKLNCMIREKTKKKD